MKLKEILEKHKPIRNDEYILIVDETMNLLESLLTKQQPSIYSECEFISFHIHEDMIVLSIYNDKEENVNGIKIY